MSKKTCFISKQSENIDSEYDVYPEIVLSERFRRSLHIQQVQHRTPVKRTRQNVNSITKIDGEEKEQAITVVPQLSEIPPVQEKLPKKRNNPGSSEKKKEGADKEISYKPFALGEFSSFNPAKIANSKKNKMPSIILAKYKAYDTVNPSVLENVVQTDIRARMFLREEREKNHAIVTQARKHWKQLHQTIKTSRGAIDARKRIKQKVNMMMSVREDEMRFLVEGQHSSIDAIRLKEHLTLNQNLIKSQKHRDNTFTERERTRVEELLA